jgi:hypothetical protein
MLPTANEYIACTVTIQQQQLFICEWNRGLSNSFVPAIFGVGKFRILDSMDKRCAPLPGSDEVFGNAYGRKPRPLLATGIVDAGARTLDKMKPAGEGKTWRASDSQSHGGHGTV